MLLGKTTYLHTVLTTFKNFLLEVEKVQQKKLKIYNCAKLICIFSYKYEHTMPIHLFKLFHLDICAAISMSKGEISLNFQKKDIDLLPVYRLDFLIIIYNY